ADNCYAPPTLSYGPDCNSYSAFTGANMNAELTYSLTVNADTGILVCCEGRGWNGTASLWYNLGCNVNGDSFSSSVPWGQSIGVPSIHCKTSDPSLLDVVTISYLC